MSTVFDVLPTPSSVSYGFIKPIHYKTDGNEYLLICPADDGNGNSVILKYNLHDKTSKAIHTFADFFKVNMNFNIVDHANNILYIIGGDPSVFISFDLNTEQIKFNQVPSAKLCFPQAIYLQSPINELHLLCDTIFMGDIPSNHYKYCMETKKWNKISSLHPSVPVSGTNGRLVYRKSTQQLILVLGLSIWYCDINGKAPTHFEWKQYQTTVPESMGICLDFLDIVFVFDSLLFTFICDVHKELVNERERAKQIWCWDLLCNKWAKSKIHLPIGYHEDAFVYRSDDNCFHCVSLSDVCSTHCEHSMGLFHIKISIHDLIPDEIIDFHRKHYEPLIMGFLRQHEKKEKCQHLPIVLKKLIQKCFPLFI